MSWADTGLLEYISFHQSTHLNYHRAEIDTQDWKKLIPQTMKFVQQDLPTVVLSVSKDPKLLLEFGTRYVSPRSLRRTIRESRLTIC